MIIIEFMQKMLTTLTQHLTAVLPVVVLVEWHQQAAAEVP